VNLREEAIRTADLINPIDPIHAAPFEGLPNSFPLKGVFYFFKTDYRNDMNKLLKKPPLKVFLCHSHHDRTAARALWSRLQRDGVNVWLDRENLKPGENWEHEIGKAILKSDAVIACLSKEFNKQEGFRHVELKIALKKAELIPEDGVFIIPVRLEKCAMPESLRHLQRVDLFERGGYKKLIHALGKQIGSNLSA
jgi:TIR domain